MAAGRLPPPRPRDPAAIQAHVARIAANINPRTVIHQELTPSVRRRAGVARRRTGRIPLPRRPTTAALPPQLLPTPKEAEQDEAIQAAVEQTLQSITPEIALTPPPPRATNSPQPPRRITANLHFTSDIAGGAPDSELRAIGPIANPFLIRSIEIVPIANIETGQFIDLLISSDTDTTDTQAPTGTSIFPDPLGLAALPSPDEQPGIAVPTSPMDIPMAHVVQSPNQTIKVRVYRIPPALALPDLHVILAIEEMPPLPPATTTTAPFTTPTQQLPPDGGVPTEADLQNPYYVFVGDQAVNRFTFLDSATRWAAANNATRVVYQPTGETVWTA